MQLNWTIIGCGWLGRSLAKKLLENGQTVFGSTTSNEKLSDLEKQGIVPFIVDSNESITSEIIELTDILILSIPPFCRNTPHVYADYISSIAMRFNAKTKVVFLSSTGIYPKKSGEYDEDYEFTEKEQETSLFNAEKQLFQVLGKRLSVLRLGGLIGEDRHPIYTILGQKIKQPNGCINFVHQHDVVRAILHITEHHAFGEVFNVVYPDHPIRKDYYTKKCKELGLSKPHFEEDDSITRKISSKKIQQKLGFQFLLVV